MTIFGENIVSNAETVSRRIFVEQVRQVGTLIVYVHPTWVLKSNKTTNSYYQALNNVMMQSSVPALLLSDPDGIDSENDLLENTFQNIFRVRTVSQADAEPTSGWGSLRALIAEATPSQVILAGQNLNFRYGIDRGQLPDWVMTFTERYRKLFNQIVPKGSRSEIEYLFPTQCLGSFWAWLVMEFPEIDVTLSKGVYPAYFVYEGNGDYIPSEKANL